MNQWKIKDFIVLIVLTIVIVLPIRMFVAQPFIVNGSSMSPTFETGQYLIIDQVSYRLHDPVRGDVVVFKFPQDPSKYFIKRIIGLPNEKIKIDGRKVYITKPGETEKILLDEPYIELLRDTFLETTLGQDEFFVMGDNRSASLDSRFWGPLERNFIIGQAFVRLFPLNKINYKPGNFDFDLLK